MFEDKIKGPAKDDRLVKETKAAFTKHEPEIRAVREDQLERVTVNIDVALQRALAAASNLAPFATLIATLPDREEGDVERLSEFTLAAIESHDQVRVEDIQQRKMQKLTDRGFTVRQRLSKLAGILVDDGTLPSAVTENLVGGASHTGLSNDLRTLSKGLKAHWSDIGPSALLKLSDIDEALELGELIYSEVAKRATVSEDGALSAAGIRSRAMTKVKSAYRDLRRAAVYLLGKTHDVNALIPPLSQPPVKRRPAATEANAVGLAELGSADEAQDGATSAVDASESGGPVDARATAPPGDSAASPSTPRCEDEE